VWPAGRRCGNDVVAERATRPQGPPWIRRSRAGQWRAARGQKRTSRIGPGRFPKLPWLSSTARSPATASTFRCTWCPARLLSPMAGHVPGADYVQGAAGQQAVAWLPGVGGDAGGERWRRCPGVVTGGVRAGGPGRGRRRLGGPGRPRGGGTRGGAGGGAAGGWLKEAAISASNSSRSHCASAQISSANAVSASRVSRSMPITLPEPAVASPGQ